MREPSNALRPTGPPGRVVSSGALLALAFAAVTLLGAWAPPGGDDALSPEDTRLAQAAGDDCASQSECGPGLFCVDGVCCTSACGGGVADCQACDVSGSVGTCTLFDASTRCDVATEACEVDAFCTGTSGVCPSDRPAPSTRVCRSADGVCDVAETCNGVDIVCPEDDFAARTVLCRESEGDCDLADYCSGAGPDCPADARAPETTVCRRADGICDVAEFCDGGVDCPADDFADGSRVCRPSDPIETPCDVAEVCSGTGPDCPADEVLPAGTVCREASEEDLCDVTELCSGDSPRCPPDRFREPGYPCRESLGVCDPGEFCSGDRATCPADRLAAAGTICVEQSCEDGLLQLADTCDGDGACVDAGELSCAPIAACGADAVDCRPRCSRDSHCVTGFLCDEDSGECVAERDLGQSCAIDAECGTGFCVDGVCCEEACGGTASDCQACSVAAGAAEDGRCSLVDRGTVCRDAVGDCDVAETCDGDSLECPTDALAFRGQLCRPAEDGCDEVERCDGETPLCPDDGRLSEGSVCAPQRCLAGIVTSPGICDADGECVPGERRQCGPELVACDAPARDCAPACRADNDCAVGYFCFEGGCHPAGNAPPLARIRETRTDGVVFLDGERSFDRDGDIDRWEWRPDARLVVLGGDVAGPFVTLSPRGRESGVFPVQLVVYDSIGLASPVAIHYLKVTAPRSAWDDSTDRSERDQRNWPAAPETTGGAR